jgi:KipI family sensor histidine kinase inhibitor
MSRHLLTCGEDAVLVELDGLEEVMALDQAARAALASGDAAFADVTDIIPAARTLLLMVREGASVEPVRRALPTLALPAGSLPTKPRDSQAAAAGDRAAAAGDSDYAAVDRPAIEIPVHYDGPDLDEVCKLTGLTRDEVVNAHTHTPWRVAFTGFSPGFAYLCGGDRRLQVPRRSEPRTSVPAGSVGLAGEFSAVYPRSTPGGWQLLGHTDAVLFDVDRQPPALLQPGSTVRFTDIGPGGPGGPGGNAAPG